jgi:hypothetical protein
MTTKTDTPVSGAPAPAEPRPGDQFHALESGVTILIDEGGLSGARSAVLTRSQTVTVTQAMLDAAKDRFGRPSGWVAWLHDEAEQVRQFGRVLLAPGPAPADLRSWTPGSPDWAEARAAARAAAWGEPNPAERARKLAAVEADFGPAASSSRTVATYARHPSEIAAEEQETQFAADRAAGRR